MTTTPKDLADAPELPEPARKELRFHAGADMNNLQLESMAGKEIKPGIWLIDEPVPVPGTDKMRCLADCWGCLCVVELKIRFCDQGMQKEQTC